MVLLSPAVAIPLLLGIEPGTFLVDALPLRRLLRDCGNDDFLCTVVVARVAPRDRFVHPHGEIGARPLDALRGGGSTVLP